MRNTEHVRAGASILYGTSMLMCDLKPGELFSFPNSDVVHRARSRGRYETLDGTRKYRTGARTAVIAKEA